MKRRQGDRQHVCPSCGKVEWHPPFESLVVEHNCPKTHRLTTFKRVDQ